MHENMLAFSCIRPVVFMRTPGRFPDVNCPNPPRITFCQYVLPVFRDFFIHLPHYKPIIQTNYDEISINLLRMAIHGRYPGIVGILQEQHLRQQNRPQQLQRNDSGIDSYRRKRQPHQGFTRRSHLKRQANQSEQEYQPGTIAGRILCVCRPFADSHAVGRHSLPRPAQHLRTNVSSLVLLLLHQLYATEIARGRKPFHQLRAVRRTLSELAGQVLQVLGKLSVISRILEQGIRRPHDETGGTGNDQGMVRRPFELALLQ